jgi:hypothetical protein
LALVGIGLELLGALFTVLICTAGVGYVALLVAQRWSVTGALLGFAAMMVWFVFVGAFSRLYVMARQAR